jgi:hypothetical protein
MSRVKPLIIALLLLGAISCYHKKDTFYTYIKGKTGIGGIVTFNGAPIEGVDVYLYRNTLSNFRGPADFAGVTDAKGSYFIDIDVSGEGYYIVARKRKSGSGSGPIKKGDYRSNPVYKPVVIRAGRTAKVDLALKQLFGTLIQKKSGQEKTSSLISGTVTDESGTPVKGVYAFAYEDDDFKREPDYFSTETDENGTFIIYFEKGGRYHLGAKSSNRGALKAGDLYGLYEGPRGSEIFIKESEAVKDIKIILKRYK